MAGIPRTTLRSALVGGVLFLGAAALYGRVLGFGFLDYGDPAWSTANPHVQGGLTWAGLRWAFGAAQPWAPLAWMSDLADWQLYGAGAAGHHLTSLLLHAANAVLLFLVARRLTRSTWTGAACAALFAWHPLRVEAVAWVAGRADVAGGTWFLACVWCQLGYVRRRDSGSAGAATWYLLTLAAYAAGLMTNVAELAAAPVVLLLVDVWLPRRSGGPEVGAEPRSRWGRLVLEKVPMMAMAAGALALGVRADGGRLVPTEWIERGLVAVARHLAAFVWPFGLSVSNPQAAFTGWLLAGAVLVVGVTWLGVAQRRERPWILLGWLWYLAMEMGGAACGGAAASDRLSYLPLIGVELAVLMALRERVTTPRARQAAAVAAGVVLAGCAVRSWSQEAVWRTTRTLFEQAVAAAPNDAFAHERLGRALLAEGQVAAAAVQCERAVSLTPESASALVALAGVRERQGRIAEAIAAYEKALTAEPGLIGAAESLGLLYLNEGNLAKAGERFSAVLKVAPDSVRSLVGLAAVQGGLGHAREAEANFRRAIGVAPDDVGARIGYGALLASKGFFAEAVEQYRAALKRRPDNAEVLARLGDALRSMRLPVEAEAAYRRSLALEADDALAQFGLGLDLEQQSRPAEALACYIRAARLKPDMWAAHLRIAVLMLDRGKPEEALVHISAALESSKAPDLVHRTWADALSHHGFYNDAIDHYEEALRLKPDDAESHALVGALLWLQGRRDEAVAHWQAALKLDPHMPGLEERLKEAGVPAGASAAAGAAH